MPSLSSRILSPEIIWKIVSKIIKAASFVHDNFLENCPKSLLFGVFDGHGGKSVSAYLEKHMP